MHALGAPPRTAPVNNGSAHGRACATLLGWKDAGHNSRFWLPAFYSKAGGIGSFIMLCTKICKHDFLQKQIAWPSLGPPKFRRQDMGCSFSCGVVKGV